MKQREDIVAFLQQHLSDDQAASGRVILMTGPWGCGKTFLWRTDVLPKLSSPPITVSLFGVDSLAALKTLIMTESLAAHASLPDKTFATPRLASRLVSAGLRRLADSTLGTNLSITIDPLHFVDDDLVICLDDIERASSSLPLEAILGVATLLSERKRARVLMVMNEEHLRERDDDAAKVMERFRERVVYAHVTVDADIESMLDLFTRARAKNLASTTLLRRARPHLLRAFSRSETKNLRTLARVVDKLLQLGKVVDVTRVSAEHIVFLAATQIEFDAGQLQPPGFYDFSDIEFLAFSTVEAKSEESQQRRVFYKTFFGDGSGVSYDFLQPLYAFVSDGYLDRARALAMVGPTGEPSELDAALEEAQSRDWWFYSDQDHRVLFDRMIALLRADVSLTAVQAITLYVYVVEGARHASIALPSDLDDLVKDRAIASARQGDESFSNLQRMKLSPFEAIWKAVAVEYDRELRSHASSTRAASIDHLINIRDVPGFLTAVTKNPENLRSACEPTNLARIVDSWSENRAFHFLALAQIADELAANKTNIMPDASAIASRATAELDRLLGLPTFGSSDRFRAVSLKQKFARV